MKRPGLPCSRALCDEEPAPTCWGVRWRQEDGVSGDQRQRLRWRMAFARGAECVVGDEREAGEQAAADQLQHRRASSCRRRLTRLGVAEQVEILDPRDGVSVGDVDGHQPLVEERDGAFLQVEPIP